MVTLIERRTGDQRIRHGSRLAWFIQQEPLIARKSPRIIAVDMELPVCLYFGIGIGNNRILSDGLPIDILAMILMAEKIGRAKHILIADGHAHANRFNPRGIERVSAEYREKISRLLVNLGFSGWRIYRASELMQEESYTAILGNIKEKNPYIRMELADMEWFRRMMGVQLKLGWILKGQRDSSETFFDRKYREMFGGGISFLYVQPGRTFDRWHLRSPPYFCEHPRARILIDGNESVESKIACARDFFSRDSFNGYIRFLRRLARLWVGLVGGLEGPLEERIQAIIQRCVQ